ncbi:hypothetical protein OBBRIDRAFT_799329, partial [Obba rivulosa]
MDVTAFQGPPDAEDSVLMPSYLATNISADATKAEIFRREMEIEKASGGFMYCCDADRDSDQRLGQFASDWTPAFIWVEGQPAPTADLMF